MVRLTSRGTHRISLAALLAVKPGEPPRLIYRAHAYRGRKDEKKGFDEGDYIRLLDTAHQQLGGPIIVVWDNLNTHRSARMRRYLAARDWLTVFHLPTHAPELNPVEGVWSHLKRSLANLTKHTIDQLMRLIKTRLKRIQHRPALLTGLLAHTHLPIGNPNY
ncbi:hypothetical protein GCM10022254_74760 [Actinomadura meridiana]|uniref:Tc1-like transposase DDE domain-containing protein n=1 Tax=Actinomadura meridiana TaxID=559626 RepID=A0ABP8CR09_9ACTN